MWERNVGARHQDDIAAREARNEVEARKAAVEAQKIQATQEDAKADRELRAREHEADRKQREEQHKDQMALHGHAATNAPLALGGHAGPQQVYLPEELRRRLNDGDMDWQAVLSYLAARPGTPQSVLTAHDPRQTGTAAQHVVASSSSATQPTARTIGH